jgi:glycosyltransferase involved in cell wall biosynthesis
VVQTHSSKAGVLGRLAARAAGADLVLHTVHGFGVREGDRSFRGRLLLAAERLAARRTDLFLPVSRENVETAGRLGLFGAERAEVVRPGFDTAPFLRRDRAEARRLLGVPEGVPLVGTVACFKAQKGPFDFVRAAALVARRVPEARFAWVGDGELRGAVEEAVAKEGLSGRFRFLGWRDDVPELLPGFDVFLLASLWEGLPKVVPQALLSGVPVVATAVDGTREALEDGVDGFLVPPGDPAAAAERVASILEGAARLDAGARRDRVVAEFEGERVVRRQAALYRRLLAERGFVA